MLVPGNAAPNRWASDVTSTTPAPFNLNGMRTRRLEMLNVWAGDLGDLNAQPLIYVSLSHVEDIGAHQRILMNPCIVDAFILPIACHTSTKRPSRSETYWKSQPNRSYKQGRPNNL
jgi:hypothetical protein